MDNNTPQQQFPLDYYLDTLVRLLDVVEYEDRNYTHDERISSLRYAYAKAADHFSQPHVVNTLKVPPKMLAAALKTIVGMVCFAWVKVSPQLQADLSIHYTYTLLLDDSREEPAPSMANWYGDLLQGNEQKHGWWRLVNDEFPNLLEHYGGYCQMNLVRSTIDCEKIRTVLPSRGGPFD
jgi:trichodiene synthase